MSLNRLVKSALPVLLIFPLNGCLLELLATTAVQSELQAQSAQSATRALDTAKTMSSNITLQQAVDSYYAEKGVYPPNLNALVPRYIAQLPVRSDGSAYAYDPATGRVGGSPSTAPAAGGIPARDRQTMEQIRQAINRYGHATGYYPPTLDALVQYGYLQTPPRTMGGLDFIYYPSNGALYHPQEFAANQQQAPAQRGQAPGGGVGVMGETMTGIGMQNQLNNMSQGATSAVRGNARSGIDAATQNYNQRQAEALGQIP